MPQMLTQGEVEERILQIDDEMQEATERYADILDHAAEAEVDYKAAFARAVLQVSASQTGPRSSNAQQRDAIATTHTVDQLRIHKIAEARKTAAKEYLNTLRARLDGLRTLGANIRAQS